MGIPSVSTGVTITVETELNVEIMIECHHCHLYLPTEMKNKFSNSVLHFVKTITRNTSRGVKEEQYMLDIITTALLLSAKAVMVLFPFKGQRGFFSFSWTGYMVGSLL